MRSRSIVNLIVVALCACTMAAQQPAQSRVGDILVVAVGEPADQPPDRWFVVEDPIHDRDLLARVQHSDDNAVLGGVHPQMDEPDS